MLNHLHVKDNLMSISLGEGLQLHSNLQMKDVRAKDQHPRFEDNVQLLCLFPHEFDCVVGLGIPYPTHLYKVVILQCSSTNEK